MASSAVSRGADIPLEIDVFGRFLYHRNHTESPAIMTKTDTIDAIKQLNPTATPEFLSEFSADELTSYLRRLTDRPSHETCEARDIDRRGDPFGEQAGRSSASV